MNTKLIMTISVFITGATPTLVQVFHPTTGSGLERRAADVLEDQKFIRGIIFSERSLSLLLIPTKSLYRSDSREGWRHLSEPEVAFAPECATGVRLSR